MSGPREIRLLPSEVIHRIAAGEVVDKPASILKEFIENSVDAGAKTIRVTLVDGGLRSIQVEDDGQGFSKADLEASVQRHATSKISSLEDLEHITNLGFRGEALSAAASVARLTIDTFREGDGAWLLRVTGGVREKIRPASRRRGTLVTLEDLFFNVPARRKFLRKPGLEAQDCVDALESLALCHPEVAFSWAVVDEGGEVRAQKNLPHHTLEERFAALMGSDAELASARAENPQPGIPLVEVVFYKPPASHNTMKSVRLSVNGRPILDKRLPYVLREAFTGLIEVGRFPCAFVKVQVDPAQVDVNIHPQKKEVRWATGTAPSSVAYRLVRQGLGLAGPQNHLSVNGATFRGGWGAYAAGGTNAAESGPRGTSAFEEFPNAGGTQATASAASSGSAAELAQLHASGDFAAASAGGRLDAPNPRTEASPLSLFRGTESISSAGTSFANTSSPPTDARNFFSAAGFAAAASPELTRPPFRFSELKVIGESGASWVLCESPQGLILIDQHAAHERVNFEKQMKRLQAPRPKPLFIPIRFSLPLAARGSEKELRAGLETLGFECADPDTIPAGECEIIAVPESERSLNWDDLLDKVLTRLADGGPLEALLEDLRVKIAASLACHGSVRRGQRLSNDEIRALLEQLDEVSWGGLCPHGRPLWKLFTNDQIANLFHR